MVAYRCLCHIRKFQKFRERCHLVAIKELGATTSIILF